MNFPLINQTGDPSDVRLNPYCGTSNHTPYLKRVPGVESIVLGFEKDGFRLLYARIAVLFERDVLRPHIDTYPAARLLVPLNESYDDFRHVFGQQCVAMKRGEVWGVDGAVVHGAANIRTRSRRVMLLIDADPTVLPAWFDHPWEVPPQRVLKRRRWTDGARNLVRQAALQIAKDNSIVDAERHWLFVPFEYEIDPAHVYTEIVDFLAYAARCLNSRDVSSYCRARIIRLQNPKLKFEIAADAPPDPYESVEFEPPTRPDPPMIHKPNEKSRPGRRH